MKKNSTTFPDVRIVRSTPLQRRDVHPATIKRINVSLSQEAGWPVHLTPEEQQISHQLQIRRTFRPASGGASKRLKNS